MATTTKSTTLFSLGAVKAYLKVEGDAHDELLVTIADGVSQRIESYTSRLFVEREVVELLDGNGRQDAFLRHFPAQSLTALRIRYSLLDAWTDLDVATEAVLDAARGRILLTALSFPKGPLSAEATYDAGYDAQDGPDLPADVVQAGLDYVKYLYDRRIAGATIATSMTIGSNAVSVAADIPADVKVVLERHRRVRAVFVR
jgi:uncharacterized phiE125 gp8 family phage protein